MFSTAMALKYSKDKIECMFFFHKDCLENSVSVSLHITLWKIESGLQNTPSVAQW